MSDDAHAVRVVPIEPGHVDGFRRVLDAVARERAWIAALQAPPIEQIRAFVERNIALGNPQFVAVDPDGQVIGWCDVLRKPFGAVSHSGSLGIGLLAPWRGRGVGARLLDATLAAADSAGLRRVELWVRVDNARAVALYRRAGFEIEGRARSAMRIDEVDFDCWTMARLQPRA